MRKIISYLNEVKVELTKVTWPKKKEVIRLVGLIFVFSVVIGAYVGALDYIFTKVLEAVVFIN